ncbi:MAG TPA: GspH/FimT family pseudopilin [Gemmatimonadales bacterium]|jgi:prepilin-type N-terminal cleavage/methylation domain-containing protein
MRRGFTLVEIALALALLGLSLAIALPSLKALSNSLAVSRAAEEIAAAHRRARMLAILRSHPVVLSVTQDSLTIRLAGASSDLWGGSGPSASGVLLPGPQRHITFSPVGLAMGLSNASFPLARGSATRTVIVSRLGRIRITQ